MNYSAKEIGEILEILYTDLINEINKNGKPEKSTMVMIESWLEELKSAK